MEVLASFGGFGGSSRVWEEVNEIGKTAFETGKMWTAELAWKSAIESQSNTYDRSAVKLFSNLAMVQIKIGRYLRSIGVGYRGFATKYLEDAISNAKKGIELDPTWERSYQEVAEAYLALGPHEYAIEAMKVLKPAFDAVAEPSDALRTLQTKAKSNATRWLSLRAIPGRTTIPQIIESSLQNLRMAVAITFKRCYGMSADGAKIGRAHV